MNLITALKDAMDKRDARKAGKIADILRFRHGLKYDDIVKLVEEKTGHTEAQFEALMYEADYYND